MARNSKPVIINGIHDTEGGYEAIDFTLLNTDSFSVDSETQTNKESIFGEDEEGAILTPVQGSRDVSLQGQTSFSAVNRVYPSYSKKKSIRTWLRTLESLVLPKQGLGWEIQDDVRGLTYDPTTNRGVLFDSVTWEYSSDGEERFDWTVQGEFSEGVQTPSSPQAYRDRVGITTGLTDKVVLPTEDTQIEFEYVDRRQLSRSVQLNSTDMIHQLEENAGDSPVLGTMESGVEADFNIGGTVYDPDTFQSTIQTFDRDLQGVDAQIHDSFSGSVWEGTIASSDSTVESARPNRFDFDITLEIGQVLG